MNLHTRLIVIYFTLMFFVAYVLVEIIRRVGGI